MCRLSGELILLLYNYGSCVINISTTSNGPNPMTFPSPAQIAFIDYTRYIRENNSHGDSMWFASRNQCLNRAGWDALLDLINSK